MGAVVFAAAIAISACQVNPAAQTDPAYSRITGLGSYLSPTNDKVVNITPMATNISYAPTATTSPDYNNPEMKFDLYAPPTGMMHPVLVYFHGGGYSGGSKAAAEIVAPVKEMVARGFVVVSANYTLNAGLRNKPATKPISDGKRLVKYLKAIAQLNGSISLWDPAKIYVAGISAGAHLASAIGMTPGRWEGADTDLTRWDSTVAGVVGFQTPYDFDQMKSWAKSHRGTVESNIVYGSLLNWIGCDLFAASTLVSSCDRPNFVAKLAEVDLRNYVATSPLATSFYLVTGTSDLVVQSIPNGSAMSTAIDNRFDTAGNQIKRAMWTDIPGATHLYGLTGATQITGLAPYHSINMELFETFLGCRTDTAGTQMFC